MKDDTKGFYYQAMNTAYSQGYDKGYSTGYDEGYEAAWNDLKTRFDTRKPDDRVNIPTEELREEIGRIKDCIDDVYDRVKRLEAVVFYGGKK